ncbi:MAG TPA: hypothetical protein VGF55_04260 [Gemmataceae bacterium]
MKKALLITGVVVAAVVVYLGLELFTIVRLQARNLDTARSLADALTARYPAFRFRGGGGYEQPYIHIVAYGVTDKAVQTEIRDWLAAEKVKRQLDARIQLEFFRNEGAWDALAEFEL